MTTTRLLAAGAASCAAGFALALAVALHTNWGIGHDLLLYRRVSGSDVPAVGAAGTHALRTIDVSSLAAAAAAIATLAALRGRPARAAAAAGIIACSVGSAELLKHGLPHIAGALPVGRQPSFPSGHTAVAASVGLALTVAAPPLLRPLAALVGAAYAAGIGLSVIVLGAHEPSDVVASFFLCGFWACAFAVGLGEREDSPRVSLRGLAVAAAAVAVALLAAAEIARAHPAAVNATRSAHALLGIAVLLGFLSLAVFAAFTPLVAERRG